MKIIPVLLQYLTVVIIAALVLKYTPAGKELTVLLSAAEWYWTAITVIIVLLALYVITPLVAVFVLFFLAVPTEYINDKISKRLGWGSTNPLTVDASVVDTLETYQKFYTGE